MRRDDVLAETQPVSLGNRLRQEREKRHWTQEQLAEKIGGSVPSINRWEHDRAAPRQDLLALLTDVFGRPPERWGSARQNYWNVPFLRNPYFTGRERILHRLHQALAAEQTVALTQTRALSGLGGIGKTQTAIEYAYRYADEYEAVLWVRADSSESLVSDFAALAVVLGLPARQERDQHYVVSTVRRWLEEHGPWLLIFDNADDVALVSDFMPRRAEGAILLTTRSQATGLQIKKIDVDKINREEGVAFLLRRIHADEGERLIDGVSQQEREAAGQIWERMEGLPLALDQAAAYIEETGCALNDYLILFQQRGKDLLRLRGQLANAHPEPVATTWLLTVEKIERVNPAAAELLRLCAFLHPDEIPEAMLIAGAGELGPVLQSIAADALAWNQAIGALRKYSMVKRDAEKKILNIHRLVQAVIRDSMEPETVRQWAERAMLLVNAAFPEAKYENWPQCEQLLTQVMVTAQWIEQYQFSRPEAARLLHETALYLRDRARYAEAEPLSLLALRIREQQLGSEHSDVAASLHQLASIYAEQGKYTQAEALLQQALRIREQQLGPEHPDVAASLNYLGAIYKDLGKFAQAEPLYYQALHIWEQQLGPQHPDVARPLNNLAELYREQGKYAQAEPLYLRAVHILYLAGPEHPDISSVLSNLAVLYAAQGKYAEAEPLYQKVTRIREQQWGAEHPNVALPVFNLAVLYYDQDNYAGAEPLFQRALRLWEQSYGPEHFIVGHPLNALAWISLQQGRYAGTESLFQRALHIWEQQLGSEHSLMASPLSGLAALYAAQSNYDEAEPLFLRALRIREQQQGPEHPETAEILHEFAVFEEMRGNQQAAHALYRRTLTIREQAIGPEHPKTRTTRQRFAALLHTMGLHEEAARLEMVQPEQNQLL